MGKKPQFFRANAGAVLCNAEGQILAFERADVPGAWQLPQGGMDADEDPHTTALREVHEETGIAGGALTLLGTHPELLAYELPENLRRAKTGRGQVQYWFYFSCENPCIDLGKEFRAWKWTGFDELIDTVVDFRRPIYAKLARHFVEVIKPTMPREPTH